MQVAFLCCKLFSLHCWRIMCKCTTAVTQLEQTSKGLFEPVLGSVWHHTKDPPCESMQAWGLEQILVHDWEFAFKLHHPHSLMQCTWGSTEGIGMSSGAMTYCYCIWNKYIIKNIRQATKQQIWLIPYLSAPYFGSKVVIRNHVIT